MLGHIHTKNVLYVKFNNNFTFAWNLVPSRFGKVFSRRCAILVLSHKHGFELGLTESRTLHKWAAYACPNLPGISIESKRVADVFFLALLLMLLGRRDKINANTTITKEIDVSWFSVILNRRVLFSVCVMLLLISRFHFFGARTHTHYT